MMIVNGYAGMRVFDDRVHFKPYIPENWEEYSFRIRFRKSLFKVTVTQKNTEFVLLEGEGITLSSGDESVILDRTGERKTVSTITDEASFR